MFLPRWSLGNFETDQYSRLRSIDAQPAAALRNEKPNTFLIDHRDDGHSARFFMRRARLYNIIIFEDRDSGDLCGFWARRSHVMRLADHKLSSSLSFFAKTGTLAVLGDA